MCDSTLPDHQCVTVLGYRQDKTGARWLWGGYSARSMTLQKSEVRLIVFRSEKGRWQQEAKKHKLQLSQFVRMIVNAKLKIPTEDLVKRVERPKPEQMSMVWG